MGNLSIAPPSELRKSPVQDTGDMRCLAEIVVRDFGANLMAFCREHAFDGTFRANLSALLNRDRSAEISQTHIRRVAEATRRDAEILFPYKSLLHRLEGSFKGTPTYQAIQKKYNLHYRGHQEPTMASLMRKKGFSKTNEQLLRNIGIKNFSTRSNRKFCLHIAEVLQIDVKELFPTATYGELQREASLLPLESPIGSC